MAPKKSYRSMQIIGYNSRKYRDFVTVNYQVILPFDYQSTFIRYSIGCHTPTCQPLFDWPLRLFVDIFAMSIHLDFYFEFTWLTNLELRLVVDPPRIHLYLVEPPQPSTCFQSTSTFYLPSRTISTFDFDC